jgi:hypothetical protein
MTQVIEVKGLDELERALEEAPELARPLARRAMELSTRLVQDLVKEYPPGSEANQPGRFSLKTKRPMGFYERGAGWWYPILQRKTLGLAEGQKRALKSEGKILASAAQRKLTPQVVGYKLSRTSELLGKSWTTEVIENEQEGYNLVGVVGNDTSYVQQVQGERQARMHASRGWRTAEQALEESLPGIIEQFEQAADELQRLLTEGK